MSWWDPRTWLAMFPAPPAPALREAAGETIDPEDDDGGWRPVSHDPHRDLSPVTQSRMQKMAVWAWERNRLCNRLIELPLAFLLAEGWKLEVDDEEAQTWLDAFVQDPINRLSRNFTMYARELGLFGELCLPVFANTISGHLRLGYIDPAAIDGIITDPDNAALPIGVVVRRQSGDRRVYKVIYAGDDEELFGEGARRLRAGMKGGECFFFRVNGLVRGKRGRSDLLSAIDKADAYDEMLFGEVERTEIQRSVMWDVTLEGADQTEIDQRAAQLDTPKPRSIRIHNEREKWSAVAPDMKAADAAEGLRTLRNDVLGGATLPEHWFGSGGDVNRASAAEMGLPTFKVLTMRQTELRMILEEIAGYVIFRRMSALGRTFDPADPELKPRAVFPDLSPKDMASASAALSQVVAAACAAVMQQLLSRETAVALIALVATQLGLKIDPGEELAKAEAEADEAAEQDVFQDPADDPEADDAGPADDAADA